MWLSCLVKEDKEGRCLSVLQYIWDKHKSDKIVLYKEPNPCKTCSWKRSISHKIMVKCFSLFKYTSLLSQYYGCPSPYCLQERENGVVCRGWLVCWQCSILCYITFLRWVPKESKPNWVAYFSVHTILKVKTINLGLLYVSWQQNKLTLWCRPDLFL